MIFFLHSLCIKFYIEGQFSWDIGLSISELIPHLDRGINKETGEGIEKEE